MIESPNMGLLARLQRSFSCDLRTLALFRINLGFCIIADLILRSRDFRLHYTDEGIIPRADLLGVLEVSYPSLHLVSGSTTVQAILFVLAGFVALCLIIGYRTRITVVLSWVLLLSLQHRNGFILQGGDQLLLLLLFWGMFLPLGARFSVDRALSQEGPATNHSFFSAATTALLIQCMCVYFFSAFLKSAPSYIPDGTAVYEALQLETYSTEFGHWLLNFPTLLKALTYYVWYLELLGPILIFAPFFFLTFRLSLQVMFITMHIGFLMFLEVGFFPYISITSLLTFTPGAVWDWLGRRLERGGSRSFTVFYDSGCDFCRKLCLGFRTFLILPGMQILPAQEDPDANEIMEQHTTWVVRAADGTYTKSDAVRYVFSLSPIFWPLSKIWPRGSSEQGKLYDWIGNNRQRFSRITAYWFPYRENPVQPTAYANAVVAFFLAVILHANLSSIDIQLPAPSLVSEVYRSLRLYQNWNMFAPAPANADHWQIPVGTLRNGTVTDVRGNSIQTPNLSMPDNPRGFYPTYRQRKYETSILGENYEAHRQLFGHYFCKKWNDRNVDEFKIEILTIYTVIERTQPDYQPTHIEIAKFWSGQCPGEEETVEPDDRVSDDKAPSD